MIIGANPSNHLDKFDVLPEDYSDDYIEDLDEQSNNSGGLPLSHEANQNYLDKVQGYLDNA